VATLARLGLDDDEVQYFAGQLSHILDHIERMERADTESVPPTANTTGLTNAMREDETAPCLPRERALQNAPDSDGTFFRVKAIQE
jgi:aspartyl-tRNA(Asn)/glutamyl-tRNA(Gln) amidotransferase subunit C